MNEPFSVSHTSNESISAGSASACRDAEALLKAERCDADQRREAMRHVASCSRCGAIIDMRGAKLPMQEEDSVPFGADAVARLAERGLVRELVSEDRTVRVAAAGELLRRSSLSLAAIAVVARCAVLSEDAEVRELALATLRELHFQQTLSRRLHDLVDETPGEEIETYVKALIAGCNDSRWPVWAARLDSASDEGGPHWLARGAVWSSSDGRVVCERVPSDFEPAPATLVGLARDAEGLVRPVSVETQLSVGESAELAVDAGFDLLIVADVVKPPG